MASVARQMLGYSRIAYLGESILAEYLRDSGGELLLFVDDASTDTQGFVARTSARQIVVAFRGTELLSTRDHAIDLDVTLVPDPVSGGNVHRGFLRAADAIMGDVLRAIEPHSDMPIMVVGHSLGGAIATLVAHRLSHANELVAQVHTFGSPRMGDALFAAAYNRDLRHVTTRHQNCCDIVTCVPSVLQGYRHVGQLRYYDALGGVNDHSTWLYRAWDSLSARAMHWGRLPTRGIADHSLNAYMSCLQ
jgi:pimeloyl-ACP methyl ester carboxylesterase